MFEAAVLLSFGTRMRTDGVAAALQSGGACTLFAEAAGAQGLSLPEFSAATKRKLRKALPHYASQNNPLDVTGQAAVETDDVLPRARGARARSRRRVRRVRRVPAARGGRGRLGRAGPASRPAAAEGDRRRVRVGGDGSARLRHGRQAVRRAGARLPFLQGHRAAAGAIRALVELQGSRVAQRSATCRRTRTARRALRLLRGASGPLDEARAARAARAVRRAAARAARPPRPRGRRDGRPRDRVPGGGEGARAGAAAQGEARRRPARARRTRPTSRWPPPRCCRRPAGPAPPPRACSSSGWRRARGAGRRRGRRVVRRLRHDAARRGAGGGRRRGVRRGAPHPRRRRSRSCARRPEPAGCPRTATTSAPSPRAVEAIARAAHDLRGRLDVARGEPAARRANAARSPWTRWPKPGLRRDLRARRGPRLGARRLRRGVAGRRIGSLWTVILGQTLSARS